ncbi:MAG: hypothetical protein ACUVXG_14280 [Anaerolineae bacterium]
MACVTAGRCPAARPPVGERQWQEDDASAIVEIALREGKQVWP